MSDVPITTDEIDAYLDGTMNGDVRAAFERRLSADSEGQRLLAECKAIDGALRSSFEPPRASIDQIESWLRVDKVTPVPRGAWMGRAILIAVLAAAASIAGVMVIGRWSVSEQSEPFFRPRALAAIYDETVENGFRPYYFCDDLERFSATFKKRQGVPLSLSEMPSDRYMVGLSYVGGLSRDTTAMLCRVDEQPVMVFVDRIETKPKVDVTTTDGTKLFVHQSQLDELVLYEVSPFSEARMLEFLLIAGGSD